MLQQRIVSTLKALPDSTVRGFVKLEATWGAYFNIPLASSWGKHPQPSGRILLMVTQLFETAYNWFKKLAKSWSIENNWFLCHDHQLPKKNPKKNQKKNQTRLGFMSILWASRVCISELYCASMRVTDLRFLSCSLESSDVYEPCFPVALLHVYGYI